jgi:hypothetical protein
MVAATSARAFLPVELVFNPNRWHRTAGISFDETLFQVVQRFRRYGG